MDEAGRMGMNVGINSKPRAKYRMLLIILPHGLGKEQVFVCLFCFSCFMVRLNHRWQDKLEVMGISGRVQIMYLLIQVLALVLCHLHLLYFHGSMDFRMPRGSLGLP